LTFYTLGYGTIFVEISLKRGEITQILGNENENGACMKNMNKRFYKNQNNKGVLKQGCPKLQSCFVQLYLNVLNLNEHLNYLKMHNVQIKKKWFGFKERKLLDGISKEIIVHI
jgi:hypothetical protein